MFSKKHPSFYEGITPNLKLCHFLYLNEMQGQVLWEGENFWTISNGGTGAQNNGKFYVSDVFESEFPHFGEFVLLQFLFVCSL